MSEIEWSPWIERTREMCPVDAFMTVSVKFTDGKVIDDRAAGAWGWGFYGGSPAEITHYRIPMEDYRRIYGEPDIEPDTSLQYEPDDVAFSAHSEEPMTGHDTVNAPSHYASGSKYHREIKPGVRVDVYDVLSAWGVTNPAYQHLIKKALQAGNRGHKTTAEDAQDIIDSALRGKEIEDESIR